MFSPYITAFSGILYLQAVWSIVGLLLEQQAFGLPGTTVAVTQQSRLILNS